MGLRAIRMAGGIALVQDKTADSTMLPKSAVPEGVADLILTPKEIADELNKIGKQKELYYTAIGVG